MASAGRVTACDNPPDVLEHLEPLIAADDRISYALLFGSVARGRTHSHSDVDIAVGLSEGARLSPFDVGELASRLETAAGRVVDVVLLHEAPPGLAYRIFRDGRPLFVRDERALRTRLAEAVLEYLDFRPLEELFARGVLAKAVRTAE